MGRKITSKNYKKVIDNFKILLEKLDEDGEQDALKEYCKEFDSFLQELYENDGFGTEGQLDPRGDQRN